MSKKRFFEIMKTLHVCSLDLPTFQEANYDPIMKIGEFKSVLENRFCQFYVPGRNLSIDKMLLRAYGLIAFNFRVITKAAHYGIKMYMCIESLDEYVLHASMYTGKGFIHEETTEYALKKQQRLFWTFYSHIRTLIGVSRLTNFIPV